MILRVRGVAVTPKPLQPPKPPKPSKPPRLPQCAVFCRTSKKEGRVLSRTAKTAKTVMKATPLKPNPPFPSSWKKGGSLGTIFLHCLRLCRIFSVCPENLARCTKHFGQSVFGHVPKNFVFGGRGGAEGSGRVGGEG